MCAITGIIGENVQDELYRMLLTLKHRGPDKSGVFVDGVISHGNLEELTVPPGDFGLGHNLLSIVGSEVVQPLRKEKIVLVCNGEIYNHSQLYSELKENSKYDFKTYSDSEVVLALITHYYQGSLSQTIPKVVEQLDGDYAFCAYDGKDLVAVRDPLGVKPLYYGENNSIFAFASEKKALWEVGINKTHSLPPKYMLHNQEPVEVPGRLSWQENHSRSKSKIGTSSSKKYLQETLKNHIQESVQKRTLGLDKVGILFSGGVDSTLLAVICADLGIETDLYAVGSEGSPDLLFAHKVSHDIGLPLHTRIVDEPVVRKYIPPVLNAIEEWNVMKLGVGMTAYLAAEIAQIGRAHV